MSLKNKIIKTKNNNIQYIKNIIIGGGLSGLNTLFEYYLKNKKSDICLFEKDNYLGGRIKTFRKKINVTNKSNKFNFKNHEKNILYFSYIPKSRNL
jgi:protoporphyrinogen oxidase